MKINQLRENWESLGKDDPYWAVHSDPTKINNAWELDDFYRSGRVQLKQLLNAFQGEIPDKFNDVLDFGCGPGRLTAAFAERATQVKGVDISEAMIELGNKNISKENCQFIHNPKSDLKLFEEGSFDLVFSNITLQHIAQPYSIEYLKEFIRCTKQGGYILFNLPSKAPLLYRLLNSTIGQKGLNAFRKIYYKKSAVIEMHTIASSQIKAHFDDHGCQLVNSIKDPTVGETWESYYYLFRKA